MVKFIFFLEPAVWKLNKIFEQGQTGGVSIAFVFFMILIFGTIGAVSHSVMTMDSRMSVNYVESIQSQYIAEAGIEYGVKLIFNGQGDDYNETVSMAGGQFAVSIEQDSVEVTLTSIGGIGSAEKGIEVRLNYRPPIGDFALYSTGEVENVTVLNEAGDPDPSLMVENALSLPDIDDAALIDMAISQGHVEAGDDFTPAHGYPNFNFYYSGATPNVTWVQGDLTVNGGRTVYGIFMVDGDIILNGSSRVEGVLYMRTSSNIVIHGGGSPTESSVTGGIVANGDVDGTGNHITVRYDPEYMGRFEEHENTQAASEIISWREL